MIISETTPLVEEKRLLVVKLEKYQYANPSEKEKDEKRLGDIEFKIREIIQRVISEQKVEVVSKTPEKPQLMTMKAAKKLLKEKYEAYRLLTLDARGLVDELVEKKKEGRDLLEKACDEKTDEKKFISGVLKF